jgi:hypothetical protein
VYKAVQNTGPMSRSGELLPRDRPDMNSPGWQQAAGMAPKRLSRSVISLRVETDLILNSIVMEVKGNLGSRDHTFPEQYKDYPP